MRTAKELQELQALPLSVKIAKTEQRLREWIDYYGLDGVYISFSGGKDSTVLLHIARNIYPDIKAVFSDTGLEFPEIRNFVKTFDNVDVVKPKMLFRDVIEKYGYPFISKEVSECVYGARKYLTRLLTENTILTDRQTDRQADRTVTDLSRLQAQGDMQAIKELTRGGYDNKYRKLRGIGEYTSRQGHLSTKQQGARNARQTSKELRRNEEKEDYP